MQVDSPSVSIYLDKRRAISSGEEKGKFPVKIRVTFHLLKEGKPVWLQKYYGTGINLSEAQFTNALSETPSRSLKEISQELTAQKSKAQNIIKDMPVINPELFELYFTGKAVRSANVEKLFNMHIARFEANAQIKSADSYKYTLNSLKRFAPGDLLLGAIDKDFLNRYEKWMITQGNLQDRKKDAIPVKRGNSLSTVGMYMRNLRAVFNDAIDQKIISRDLYPFGKRGYKIPEGEAVKKALNESARTKLINYEPKSDTEAEALDFWKFSYYCNGMNFIDIAYLKKENIDEELLHYVRRKTKDTERKKTVMSVPLRDEVKEIIKKRAIHKPYIFGIIKEEMSPRQQRLVVADFVKRTNTRIRRICEALKIPHTTVYTARHTAATVYLRAKTDLKTIQEILGHSSISTTERYLKSIDIEEKKKLTQLL